MKRKDCFFGLHFDFHANAETPDIGADFDESTVERIAREVKPDFIQCDTKGHPGFSSYPTKKGNPAPHICADILSGWRRATKKHGILLFAHYSGIWDKKAVQDHPEWAAVSADGKITDRASVFGDYAEKLLIPQLKELALEYGLDGAWVDGECWAQVLDYGKKAETAWISKTGTLPPKNGDALYPEFLDFQRQAFFAYVKNYIGEVKKAAPEFEITSNWLNTAWAPDDICITDYISGDLSPTNSVDSARFDGRIMQSFGRNWDIMSWGISYPVHYVKSAVQLCQEAAVILSLGGGFQIYNMQSPQKVVMDEWAIPVWAEVAGFCRARQPYCQGARPLPDVGILYSPEAYYAENFSLFCRDNGYNLELNGFLTAVCDQGYSVSVIHAQRLLKGQVDLAAYKTVVISNFTALEQGIKEMLLDFTRAGGNLVLCGKNATEYFAEDLCLQMQWDPPQPVIIAHGPGYATELRVPYVKISHAREWESAVYVRECDIKGDLTCSNPPPTIVPRKEQSMVSAVKKYGKGNVCVITPNIGRVYLENRPFELRMFLSDCLKNIKLGKVKSNAGGKADVLLTCSAGREFIHVINLQGEHRSETVKTFTDIPPVCGVEIEYMCAVAPRKVLSVLSGNKIKFAYKNGILTFKTDVKIHSVFEIVY